MTRDEWNQMWNAIKVLDDNIKSKSSKILLAIQVIKNYIQYEIGQLE